jgi:hypothetical protein
VRPVFTQIGIWKPSRGVPAAAAKDRLFVQTEEEEEDCWSCVVWVSSGSLGLFGSVGAIGGGVMPGGNAPPIGTTKVNIGEFKS